MILVGITVVQGTWCRNWRVHPSLIRNELTVHVEGGGGGGMYLGRCRICSIVRMITKSNVAAVTEYFIFSHFRSFSKKRLNEQKVQESEYVIMT